MLKPAFRGRLVDHAGVNRSSASQDYLSFFFSCLAVRFSFIVFAGFFFSLFFESMPLLMTFLRAAIDWMEVCYGMILCVFGGTVKTRQMRSSGAR